MNKPETGMNAERDTPAMSVILPVHNAGKFLNTAIESVLRQSKSNFELLLLDDGSSDDSLRRLEYFAARDTRCKVHSWPNQGVPRTLNEGIRLARADILVRMDADDICHPQRFEKQMQYLNAHPECVAVGTQVMLIDPEGWPIRPFVETTRHALIDAEHLAGRGGAIAHPSVAMRKSAVVGIGGYRTEFARAQDIDLFLRLAEVGQLANLPEVLLDYRQHLNSIGYKHRQSQHAFAERAVADALRRRGLSTPIAPSAPDTFPKIDSKADVHRIWGWWALSAKNLRTARKHAFKALQASPFDTKNLKLIACVARGY
jgi:glycosyltransferase involved in cell wall biosynthesis